MRRRRARCGGTALSRLRTRNRERVGDVLHAPGPDDLNASPTTYAACVIHLSAVEWPNWREDDENFPALCQLIAHELGHFEGYGDPGAAEGTIQSRNLNVVPFVPPCRHWHLWYDHEWIWGEVA
jgi:hypothetical protein